MLFATDVQAQDADSSATSAGLEEVVVTAQRREESLQDAAIAIESIDQSSLTRQGLESAQDLGQISPALGISAGGGPLTSIFVRGVGALTVNPLTDAAIAQNVDGVYLGRSSGAAGQALFDLERIELLKGPQGTLYGRNATGGVINYIPEKPVLGENSGYIQAEVGDYSKTAFQGAVNFGSGSETVAVRLAGNVLNRDGYSSDGTNDADSVSFRGQILFEPSDQLSVRFAADYSENNAKGFGGTLYGNYALQGDLTQFTPSGIDVDSGPSSVESNAVRTSILHTPSFAPFQDIESENLFQDISFTGFMAEIDYEMDSGTFTLIPAYRESDQDYQFSGPGFAPAKTQEENNQTSLEARFTTDLNGRFNGIFGAFYIDEEIQTSTVFAQQYSSPVQNYANGGDSWAIFGQGTFDVSETFRVNAGIRYTEDSKFASGTSDTFITFCGGAPFTGDFLTPGPPPNSFTQGCNAIDPNTGLPVMPAHPITNDREAFIQYFVDQGLIASDSVATIPGSVPGPPPVYNLLLPGGAFPGSPPQLGAIVNLGEGFLESSLDFSEVTYRLGLEKDWGDSNLLYVGYERGYRAGGVDLSVAAPTYDSEFIDAFTIGSKNRFLDNTLQVNAELFLWDYTDQQVTYFTTLGGPAAFPIANGDAQITGLDVDVIWAASDNTTLYGNVQFLDSKYDRLELIGDPGTQRFDCNLTGIETRTTLGETLDVDVFDCSGQPLLYSPEFGLDLGINHILNINSYELSLTADVSHRDEQSTSFTFLPETVADSYTTLNLDATLSPDGAAWALSVYMRNVTDERYLMNTNVSNRGLNYGIYNPPQTFGVRFRADF